jgi:hypothetical protein
MSDLIGWSLEDIGIHVEDEYRSQTGVFEMTTVIGEITGFRTALDSFVVEDENGNTCLIDFSEFETAYLRAKKRRDEAEKALEKQLKNKKVSK